MHSTGFSRIAATFGLLATGTLIGTACSDADQPPTAVTTQAGAAASVRQLSPRGASIRQHVADARRRHLSAGETARVASLKGRWQWVADLHHDAMQGAMHDPSLHGLRQRRTPAERCATAVRYMTRFSPAVEVRSGQRYDSENDRKAAIRRFASQVGVCPAQPAPASIFAAVGPSFKPLVRSALLANRSVIHTATGDINIAQVSGAWRDYVNAMASDLRLAKDLGDANEIMDTYVAMAASDADVSPVSLALIAGTVDLAASSAKEWDTFARPREGSLFMWGWLSDLGGWVDDVLSADVGGCISGVEVAFLGMPDFGSYGSLTEFVGVTASFCAVGGILGSIAAAI